MNKEIPYTLEPKKKAGLNIEAKRILFRAIQYWYFIALSLIIAFTIAFFKTRYAIRIYSVTASIVIKEKEEASEGRLLYNNPLVSGFRNYLNEPYIIRSYPLIQRTLDDINFGVAFYREGNVLTTEVYDIPVTARIVNKNGNGSTQFYFTALDVHRFKLSNDEDETEGDSQQTGTFSFGDTVSYSGLSLIFSKRENNRNLEIGSPYLFTYTDPEFLTGSYAGRLKATWAEEGAGVINLAINGPNPSKEIDFLKGLISQYQQYDLDKKNQTSSRTIDFITEQLMLISDSLHNVERQLEKFKDENVITDLGNKAERLYTKLEPLEAQKIELIVKSNYYKYLTDYIKNGENLDHIISPSSMGINDGVLATLISRMVDIQLQLKLNDKSDNPLVNDSKRMINEIKRDIVESIRNQQSTDNIKEDALNKQIVGLEKQLGSLPFAERKLVSIQRNFSLLENLYIFLLQKRAEASISKASTITDIGVVNPPMLAGGAISPKPSSNYLFALVFGLGIPAIGLVLMELLNTKVQSKVDVERVTSMPFISGVGHMRSRNNLEVLTTPKSSISESFRAMRSNLHYFLGNREKAVILITSSISGEGKTFTSVNLSSVFALSGRRTLIVGADMRKPKIFQDFELHNDVGLSTFLSGMSSFDDVVKKTSHPLLDVVSGGPVPPNPAELLLTKNMEIFLEEAKRRYDFIILDTPPLVIVADAFALTRFADHTLFLVRQNYTTKSLLLTVNEFYSSGKLTNVSIVLNDIAKTGPGYGYGYGDGYGYGYGIGYGNGSSKRNGYGYYSES